MARPRPDTLSRRRFLATAGGAAAGVVLLGACGGDDDTDADGPTTTAAGSDLVLANYLQGSGFHAAGSTTRLVFGIADSEGLLTLDDTPAELQVVLLGPAGRPVGDPLTLERHGAGLPRAYFPLEIDLDEPGIYTVRAELGGPAASEMAFEVKPAEQVTMLKPGEPMPPAVTPTPANTRDVTPICTGDPVCPYHDISVADALPEGRPMALLVSTPAFCVSAACGPVHQVFVDEMDDHPDIRSIHAEVYLHPEINRTDFAPVLSELRLISEPTLFLVGSDGIVRERLDGIYDAVELRPKLAALT